MLAPGQGLPRDMYLMFAGDNPETYGYMVRDLTRSSAAEYAPRFGTGKSDETDLSLLKAETYTFGGGMFQRRDKENDKGSIIYGYYNGYDDTLYPYPNGTAFGSDYYGIPTAETYGNNLTFIATRQGSTNKLIRINKTGVQTLPALPTAVSTAAIGITDMVVLGKYLYVATQDTTVGVNIHRFDTITQTWQDVGGQVNRLAVLRGRLYGLASDGNIWVAVDPFATTITWNLLYYSQSSSLPTAFFEFNGALWNSIQGRTYRFDGVNQVEVLNHECIYAEVYNGAVYYMVKNWLYRFNGSIVEKLQYFDETVYGIRADDENLYVVTQSPLSKYSGYDSSKTPSMTLLGRLYYFNGEAWYEAYESYTSNPESGFTSWPYALARNYQGIVLIGANSASGYGYTRRHSYTEAQTKFIGIYSSELKNGYPNNWKYPQYIDINADGWDTISSETLNVQVQLHNGLAWSDWISIGTATSAAPRVEFFSTEGWLYKSIRVRITNSVPSTSTLSVRSFTLRYSLQPRQRSVLKCDFVIPSDTAAGTKDRRNVRISDASGNNSTALYYSFALDRALYSKIPVFLLGVDFTQANNPSVGTGTGNITLAGSMPFSPIPNTIDEIAYVGLTNDDGVTWEIASIDIATPSLSSTNARLIVNLKTRGIVGTPITIGSDTIISPAYQVFCNRLINERIIANGATNMAIYDTAYNDPEASNIERIKVLEFIEV
jgi:hypothetical protein